MIATGIQQTLRRRVCESSEMRKMRISVGRICIKEVGKGLGDFLRISLSVFIDGNEARQFLGDFPVDSRMFNEDRIVDKLFRFVESFAVDVVNGKMLEKMSCSLVERCKVTARNRLLVETLGEEYFGAELIGDWSHLATMVENLFFAKELWGIFMKAFEIMCQRDRAIVMERSMGRTFQEIGSSFGVTSSRARVLYEASIQKLKVWKDYCIREAWFEAAFPIGRIVKINTPFVQQKKDGNYRIQKWFVRWEHRGADRGLEEAKIGTVAETGKISMEYLLSSSRRNRWRSVF